MRIILEPLWMLNLAFLVFGLVMITTDAGWLTAAGVFFVALSASLRSHKDD